MEIIKWMIKVFSWPILLMNTVGGIVSGLWLILLGRWAEVGLGILVLMAGGFLVGFAMLPGFIFSAPIMYFQRKAIKSGMRFFAFLSVAYTMLVITIWCSAIFFAFATRADSAASLIALLLWSYSVAIGPLAFLAQKDTGNEYSMLSTFFAQAAYLLVIALAIVVGISPLIAFIMIGGVMLCAALVEFRIAGEEERAQEPAVSV